MKTVKIQVPEDCSVILGQSHFIKTVEDIFEALISSVPGIKFGVGFCEASGPALVRHTGNDKELEELAANTSLELSCGHSFIIFMKEAYPINVLEKVKNVQEVVNIFAATSNPLEVIIAETGHGKGILGVVDGIKSKGIEKEKDEKERKEFLRKIGYKQ